MSRDEYRAPNGPPNGSPSPRGGRDTDAAIPAPLPKSRLPSAAQTKAAPPQRSTAFAQKKIFPGLLSIPPAAQTGHHQARARDHQRGRLGDRGKVDLKVGSIERTTVIVETPG